jgi:hypothetical protein
MHLYFENLLFCVACRLIWANFLTIDNLLRQNLIVLIIDPAFNGDIVRDETGNFAFQQNIVASNHVLVFGLCRVILIYS